MTMTKLCFKLQKQVEMFQCYDRIHALLVDACYSKSSWFSAFYIHLCFLTLFILTNTMNSSFPLKGQLKNNV